MRSKRTCSTRQSAYSRSLISFLFCLVLITLLSCTADKPEPGIEEPVEEAPRFEEPQAAETPATETPAVQTAEEESAAEETPAAETPAAPGDEPVEEPELETDTARQPEELQLEITSPADGSVYLSTVTVEGYVRAVSPDEKVSIKYHFLGTVRKGRYYFEQEGPFRLNLTTTGFSGDLPLLITAMDDKGNTTEAIIHLLDGGRKPVISVFTPSERDSYGSFIHLSGIVSDSVSYPEVAREISYLNWSIAGTYRGGRIPFDRKTGSYRIEIPTRDFSGDVDLRITASDYNRHITHRYISLKKGVKSPVVTSAITEEILARAGRAVEEIDRNIEFVYENYIKPLPDAAFRSRVFDILTAAMALEKSSPEITAETRPGREPRLIINSPENGIFYSEDVPVSGTIVTRSDGSNRLQYRLGRMSEPPRAVPFDENAGTFRLELPLSNRTGPQVLTLEALDSSGVYSVARLHLYDGNREPGLHIISPRDGEEYGAYVSVKGVIVGSSELTLDEIEAITYEVTSTEVFEAVSPAVSGEAELRKDGFFDFTFASDGLAGPQEVKVTTLTKSGFSFDVKVSMADGERGIPLFEVFPGDKHAILDWERVPGATSHAAYYVPGTVETPNVRGLKLDGISPPVYIYGLENGAKYTFQIGAVSGDKADLRSKAISAIPLSPLTLKPAAIGEYEQVRLTWKAIPGAGEFEVLRGIKKEGEYENISGSIKGNDFLDTGVRFGKKYYYRIRPTEQQSIVSESSAAETLAYPQNRFNLSGFLPGNQFQDIDIGGDYVYLAAGENGLKVIDVYEPRNPEEVGTYPMESANGLIIRDEFVFVADGSRGLKVIEITNPRKPEQVGSRKTSDARDVVLRDNIAFVADGDFGVKVMDIANPRNPERLQSLNLGNVESITLDDRYAYLIGSTQLSVLDISDPENPTELGICDLPGGGRADIRDGYAFVTAGKEGVKIVDVIDPKRPRVVGTIPASDARGLTFHEDLMFLADGSEGLRLLDVADIDNPVSFDSYEESGATLVAVKGDYAFLVGSDGLKVVQIMIEGKSFVVASCATDGKSYAVTLDGDFAYLADHQGGIKVVDISEPSAVDSGSIVGQCPTLYAESVAVSGGYAFAADAREGLVVIDLAGALDGDPQTQPEKAGTWSPDDRISGIQVRDDLVFLTDFESGLAVVDVSDPRRPNEIGTSERFSGRDLVLGGDYAYVAADSGLQVIDISQPDDPRTVAAFSAPGARKIDLKDSMILMLGSSGLYLIDVTVPVDPKSVGFYETFFGEDVASFGGYAYLAEGFNGLQVLDLSNPEDITVVSVCDELYAAGIAVRDNYVFVADTEGLQVVHVIIPPWFIR